MGNLGTMIRTAREEHGWSLRQLGNAADLHFVHIRDIESGKVSHPVKKTLEGLSSALKLPLHDLILASYGEPNGSIPQQEEKASRRQRNGRRSRKATAST